MWTFRHSSLLGESNTEQNRNKSINKENLNKPGLLQSPPYPTTTNSSEKDSPLVTIIHFRLNVFEVQYFY